MTRRRTLTVTALAVIGIAAAGAVETPTKLIWNATASAPVGFYTVEPADRIDVPELVAVMYADVRPELHEPAGRSVTAHLIALVDVGVVVGPSADGTYRRA